jgi:hypothetical protein
MWIEVPARDDYYYILLRGESIDDTNIPVAVLRRLAGNLVLTDLPSVPRDTVFYRVRQVHSASAFDSEQDGVAQSGGRRVTRWVWRVAGFTMILTGLQLRPCDKRLLLNLKIDAMSRSTRPR